MVNSEPKRQHCKHTNQKSKHICIPLHHMPLLHDISTALNITLSLLKSNHGFCLFFIFSLIFRAKQKIAFKLSFDLIDFSDAFFETLNCD